MSKVLVTGATGRQGGAVIDALLSGQFGSHEVFGLTRDGSSPRAQALADRGITVVEGDMTDEKRMRALCDGMDAVFCVTTFFEDGPEIETEQGVTCVDAAQAAGVDHVVYSSVMAADGDTGLAHFESKRAVEEHIDEVGIDATIIRPTFFMQNFEGMWRPDIEQGQLAMPLAPDTTLQLVDATDIGVAAAMAITDPETFKGEVVELAGAEHTLEELCAAFSEALDRDIEPVYVDVEAFRAEAGDEMADMFVWFNEVGYDVDIEALDALGIDPTTFTEYLAKNDTWRPAPTPTR
ncbi:NmrA/HSCARG family protein [Natronomonas sp. EA1]|uniref:NmrA/HSCARG family protein n=1 Tax=Natronomonas sp. EA1 TaxID=3421655 RepID=UPI003EB8DCAA